MTEAKQTIARISAFTSRAIERLQTGKPGDTVTADQMRDVIGMDCRSRDKGYSYVRSAIHHVESQHGIVWAWDRDGDQVFMRYKPGQTITMGVKYNF